MQVYFVHPDHLDTPRVVLNAANQPVWTWESSPYGDTPADSNPSALGAFDYTLRFPGQQHDAETGQHYNYFRDDEASTGRYVQSDPSGVSHGPNTYSYAYSEPLITIDATGLSGNSNSTKGPCVVYTIYSSNGINKVGESCRGNNKKELRRRCESQARKLTRTTGTPHSCIVSPALPCGKKTIKKIEPFLRNMFRSCGCELPGNRGRY